MNPPRKLILSSEIPSFLFAVVLFTTFLSIAYLTVGYKSIPEQAAQFAAISSVPVGQDAGNGWTSWHEVNRDKIFDSSKMVKIYVSSNGNNANDGLSMDKSLQTLDGAHDKAGKIVSSGKVPWVLLRRG